jgi:hypothetical protein
MNVSLENFFRAQAYICQFFELKEEEFVATLDEAVTLEFVHINGVGFEVGERIKLNGKINVTDFYHRSFFLITSNIDVDQVDYRMNSVASVVINVLVKEDKLQSDGTTQRYQMRCQIQLNFGENGKITGIWDRTEKELAMNLQQLKIA